MGLNGNQPPQEPDEVLEDSNSVPETEGVTTMPGDDAAENQAEEAAQDEFDDEDEVTEAETQVVDSGYAGLDEPEADDAGDEPPVEPEAPSLAEPKPEPMPPVAEDLIAQAVEISFADFSKRHPMTSRHLKSRIGNPVDIVVQGLMEDEAFKSLMSRTAEATDAADIVKVIASIALKVAERILVTL